MVLNSRFIFTIILILSVSGQLFAQQYTGVVVNEKNLPLAGVQLKDTLSKWETFTDNAGRFTITAEEKTIMSVYRYGYEPLLVKVNTQPDTIRLTPDSRLLERVIINSERITSVRNELNENVLDYVITDKFVLTLCAENRKRYLVIKYPERVPKVFSLGKLKAKSLTTDCYGNIHILTRTQAHQIWFKNGQLEFVMEAPIDQFNNILAPCVAAFDSSFVIYDRANHNQRYTLAVKEKGQPQFSPFYTVWDQESELSARALYYEIIALYMQSCDSTENVIINKIWDGDVMRLAQNYELMVLVGFYKNVISQPVEVESFRSKDEVFLFDMAFDSLQTFDAHGNHISSQSFPLKKPEKILQDQKTDIFYSLHVTNGVYQVGEINLKDENIETVLSLTEAPFAENIQIHNGWIYFLSSTSAFKKLYKIRL